MSNAEIEPGKTPETTGRPGHSGSRPATTPSTAKNRGKLSGDRPVWERQDSEPLEAFDAFCRFRDDENRVVKNAHPDSKHAYDWSSYWSWGHRAFEWDLYLARKDAEDRVRYQRLMNERHRAIGRAALNKVTQWIVNLDADQLSPQEAARLLEVASKLERMGGGVATDQVDVRHSGKVGVEQLSAEEVREQLLGIQAEIERLTVEQGSSELPEVGS